MVTFKTREQRSKGISGKGRFVGWCEEFYYDETKRGDHQIVCKFVVIHGPHKGATMTGRFKLDGNGTAYTSDFFEACNGGEALELDPFDDKKLSALIGRKAIYFETAEHTFRGNRQVRMGLVRALTVAQREHLGPLEEGVKKGTSIRVDPPARSGGARDDDDGMYDDLPHAAEGR